MLLPPLLLILINTLLHLSIKELFTNCPATLAVMLLLPVMQLGMLFTPPLCRFYSYCSFLCCSSATYDRQWFQICDVTWSSHYEKLVHTATTWPRILTKTGCHCVLTNHTEATREIRNRKLTIDIHTQVWYSLRFVLVSHINFYFFIRSTSTL